MKKWFVFTFAVTFLLFAFLLVESLARWSEDWFWGSVLAGCSVVGLRNSVQGLSLVLRKEDNR